MKPASDQAQYQVQEERMSQASVSVILPVYNIEEYLPQCMESLFNQTYKDFEIIIVDDGSRESCSRLCDSYKDHEGVTVYHKKNGGISDTRNYGIENPGFIHMSARTASFRKMNCYIVEMPAL